MVRPLSVVMGKLRRGIAGLDDLFTKSIRYHPGQKPQAQHNRALKHSFAFDGCHYEYL